MNDIRRISQSDLKDFQRCKRRYWLRHVRRLAPRLHGPTGPLQSGTRVHAALEAFYTPNGAVDPRQALEDAISDAAREYHSQCQTLGVEPDAAVIDKFLKDTDLERAMVEGYFEWLADTGADAHLQVIGAEEQVRITSDQLGADFGQLVEIVGKLDARVLDEVTGFTQFVDHKTVQNFAQVLPTLQSDPQMLHYHLLLSIVYPEQQVDGALYNMLRKVKRGKTAKPPFYMRETIVHNADEVESYRLRLIGLITNVIEFEARIAQLGEIGVKMFAQPNPTRDCSWDCSFFDVCGMFDDGSRVEDAIRDLFEERDPHERYAAPMLDLCNRSERQRGEDECPKCSVSSRPLAFSRTARRRTVRAHCSPPCRRRESSSTPKASGSSFKGDRIRTATASRSGSSCGTRPKHPRRTTGRTTSPS
jgi:hypothetical protein